MNRADVLPICAMFARYFICAPVTSVTSESLFSKAGCILAKDRNRITAENAEMLTFLYTNAHSSDFLAISGGDIKGMPLREHASLESGEGSNPTEECGSKEGEAPASLADKEREESTPGSDEGDDGDADGDADGNVLPPEEEITGFGAVCEAFNIGLMPVRDRSPSPSRSFGGGANPTPSGAMGTARVVSTGTS